MLSLRNVSSYVVAAGSSYFPSYPQLSNTKTMTSLLKRINPVIMNCQFSEQNCRVRNFYKQLPCLTLSQRTDSNKLKEMTISNLTKIVESSPTSRKHRGTGRNCSLWVISPFPSLFQRLVLQTRKNQGLFGKGLKYC